MVFNLSFRVLKECGWLAISDMVASNSLIHTRLKINSLQSMKLKIFWQKLDLLIS